MIVNHFEELIDPWGIRGRGSIALAQLRYRIAISRDGIDELVNGIEQLVNQQQVQLLWMDLWSFDFQSSTTLGFLFQCSKALSDQGKRVIIFDLTPMYREVFPLILGKGQNRMGWLPDMRWSLFPLQETNQSEEERCFLQAIREEPAEMAHRWVYSDWLDERGDDRAELVRLCTHFLEQEIHETGEYVPNENDLLNRSTETPERNR